MTIDYATLPSLTSDETVRDRCCPVSIGLGFGLLLCDLHVFLRLPCMAAGLNILDLMAVAEMRGYKKGLKAPPLFWNCS